MSQSNIFTPIYPTIGDGEVMLQKKLTAMESGLNGIYGATLVNDTAAHTGTFCGIKALSGGAVVASITGTRLTDFDASFTIAGGDYIPILFTAITLTSGNVILYHDRLQ